MSELSRLAYTQATTDPPPQLFKEFHQHLKALQLIKLLNSLANLRFARFLEYFKAHFDAPILLLHLKR